MVDSGQDMCILMYMPTKHVYIAEADLPLLDRAAELAGGISAAVIAGIRLYLERSEREMGRFRQIEVAVNDGPLVVTKRFQGRRLFRLAHRDGPRVITYEVYATARQQFAVYSRDDPDYARLSSAGGDPIWENPDTWAPDFYNTRDRTLQVFPGVDAMETELPSDVIDAVRRALDQSLVEDLDILTDWPEPAPTDDSRPQSHAAPGTGGKGAANGSGILLCVAQ